MPGAEPLREVGWWYSHTGSGEPKLLDRVAVHAAPSDAITLDGLPVVPQPGGFYGGWLTPEVVGPFKGGQGSWGW